MSSATSLTKQQWRAKGIQALRRRELEAASGATVACATADHKCLPRWVQSGWPPSRQREADFGVLGEVPLSTNEHNTGFHGL